MVRAAAAALLGALALASGIVALPFEAGAQSSASPPHSASPQATDGAPTEAEARSVCTPCHAFPPADILPRSQWRDEVTRMSLIRDNRASDAGSSRLIALPPDFERALRYFEAHAPERLRPPTKWPDPDPLTFVTRGLSSTDPLTSPAVANVRLVDIDGDSRLELLSSDMRSGTISLGRPYVGDAAMQVLATLLSPAHVSLADFDKNGITDLFVADLGRFVPSDHSDGAVLQHRNIPCGAPAERGHHEVQCAIAVEVAGFDVRNPRPAVDGQRLVFQGAGAAEQNDRTVRVIGGEKSA